MSAVRTAEDIGAVIRARRRQLGCTQQDLADRAGLSRQSVVAIEQGKERAALAAVLRVLLELGLEADVFAPEDAHQRTEEPAGLDLQAYLRGFTDGAST